MADSRPGGIEKIAHLFIAGNGASNLRARENSPVRWTGPKDPADRGNGRREGQGASGVREGLPGQTAAEIPSDSKPSGADGSANGVANLLRGDASEPMPPTADPVRDSVGPGADPSVGPAQPVDDLAAVEAARRSQAFASLQGLLSRAKVAAVLSGHMGPLAGPAAELFAKTLAREGSRVAMLYGPADFACLHRFGARPAEEADISGNGDAVARDASIDSSPCDVLLLPDWVFQFDLWPMTRGMHSMCLAYGAGSEGLMGAYGALKGLISRFGKPEDLLLLPFGCNEQEETWVHERLADMCRRFLDLEPRVAREKPDLRVHAGKLMPIDGGSEGVKQLFAAIGQIKLTFVPRPREPVCEPQSDVGGQPERAAMPQEQVPDREVLADVTSLVPVAQVPADGEAVLRALIEQRQADSGFFDIWSRHGVAGTILGSEGLIGAAGEICDLLGFSLWLCRQAQAGEIEELCSITIAVRQPDEWLIEAGRAMPVPIRWVSWRTFELGGQLGLCFEPVAD